MRGRRVVGAAVLLLAASCASRTPVAAPPRAPVPTLAPVALPTAAPALPPVAAPPASHAPAAVRPRVRPPASFHPVTAKAREAVLSPRLQAVVGKPAAWFAAAAKAGSVAGLPAKGPGSLLRPSADSLIVDIRMKSTDPSSIGRLTEAGANILDVESAFHTATAVVRTIHLGSVAKTEGVESVQEALTPYTSQTTVSPSPSATPAATPMCDPVVSEGDVQLNALLARTNHNVDGTGTTVGIVSDSYDIAQSAHTRAVDDVTAGALPGPTNPCGHTAPVNVLDDSAPASFATDEGRAMAQIVHGLAPGAKIVFATGCCTQEKMASNIIALAGSGAKIIVDDLSFLSEPVYQDGPIADAIAKVRSEGVTYFSATGNNNIRIGGHDVGSYETPKYRSMVCPLPAPYVDCHNFAASGTPDFKYGLTIAPKAAVIYALQWAQPWFGVTTDLDLVAFDDAGKVVGYSDATNTGSNGTQTPFELVPIANASSAPLHVNLVVGRITGADVRFKLSALHTPFGAIVSVDRTTSYGGDVVGPTVFGHDGSANTISVGAINYQATTAPEPFSSRGPVAHLFAPVDGTKPGATLASPQVIAKPDVVASDCVRTTFFGDFDGHNFRFCGTSAAAPHAAAIAALAEQQLPAAAPLDISAALTSTAVDLPPVGRDDASGAGLIDADAALTALKVLPKPSSTPTPSTTPVATKKATLKLSAEQVKVGNVVNVSGSNFPPHTLLNIYLHSNPVFLGSTPTTDAGSFSIDLFIPSGVPSGAHTIEVRVATTNDVAATAPITIAAATLSAATTATPSKLPRTGGDISRMFLFAIFALCAGGSLVLWSRMETVKLAVASVRAPGRQNLYAVLARGRDALPEVTRVHRAED